MMENQKRKKILVVDDDRSILDAVSMILEDADYTVETSFKGEETCQRVAQFQPDVILLDILMSGSDGREICRKLKLQPDTGHIPVIMISAHPTAKESSIKNGADAFLAKPFESSDLLDIVARCMRYT